MVSLIWTDKVELFFRFDIPECLSVNSFHWNTQTQQKSFEAQNLSESNIFLIAETLMPKRNVIQMEQTLVPTYSQFKQEKIPTTPLLPRSRIKMSTSNTTTPSKTNLEYIHQVYMREDDFNVLTRTGNIFFYQGRPHFTQNLD